MKGGTQENRVTLQGGKSGFANNRRVYEAAGGGQGGHVAEKLRSILVICLIDITCFYFQFSHSMLLQIVLECCCSVYMQQHILWLNHYAAAEIK